MDEAKRIQANKRNGSALQIRDPLTGQSVTMRWAPSVRELAFERNELNRRNVAGEHAAAVVPCNGCTACCRGRLTVVDPHDERSEDIAHLSLSPNPDKKGTFLLNRRADGACIHLDDAKGCTVRPWRPGVCRSFDCRLLAGAGVRAVFRDGNGAVHTTPAWHLDQRASLDRQLMTEMAKATQGVLAQGEDMDRWIVWLYQWVLGRIGAAARNNLARPRSIVASRP